MVTEDAENERPLDDDDADGDGGVEMVEMVEFVAKQIDSAAEETEVNVAFITKDDGKKDEDGGSAELTHDEEMDLSWFDKDDGASDNWGVKLPGWDDAEDPKPTVDILIPPSKNLKVKKHKRKRSNAQSSGSATSPPTPPTPRNSPISQTPSLPSQLPPQLQLPPPLSPFPSLPLPKPIARVVLKREKSQYAPAKLAPNDLTSSEDLTPLTPHAPHLDPAAFYEADLCTALKTRTGHPFLRDNHRITRPPPSPVDFIPAPCSEDHPPHVYHDLLENSLVDQFLAYCANLQDYFVGKQWDWVDNATARERAGLWSDLYYPELGEHEEAIYPVGAMLMRTLPHHYDPVIPPWATPTATPASTPRIAPTKLGEVPELKPVSARGPVNLDALMEWEDELENGSDNGSDVTSKGPNYHMKTAQEKISELLACGQVLMQSDLVAHDEVKTYEFEQAEDVKSQAIVKRAEGMLRPLLLSASNKSGPAYDSAACVYIDDGAKFKQREDDDGALVKYVAVVAMDGGAEFERESVEYWGSKITIFRELIAEYKRENQWTADGGSLKDILINHVTNELVEYCRDRLNSLIENSLLKAKKTWEWLERFDDESGKGLDEELRQEVERFLEMLEGGEQLVDACYEAENILDTRKAALEKAEKLHESLSNTISQPREGLYFPEGLQKLLDEIDNTLSDEQMNGTMDHEAKRATLALNRHTHFPLRVLIRQLAQYPESIRRLISLLGSFSTRFSLTITHIPPACFLFPPSPNFVSQNVPIEATHNEWVHLSADKFRDFVTDNFHFKPAYEPVKHYGVEWLETSMQTVPRVHSGVRVLAWLVCRGLEAVGGLFATTNTCCWTCGQYFSLVAERLDIDLAPVNTGSKIMADWAFPDLEVVWKVLDQQAEEGYFRRPGLTRGAEEERRRELGAVMGWVENDLVRDVADRVKRLAESALSIEEEDVVVVAEEVRDNECVDFNDGFDEDGREEHVVVVESEDLLEEKEGVLVESVALDGEDDTENSDWRYGEG